MEIRYISTNRLNGIGKTSPLSFTDALSKGIADDGGLFMPDSIPQLNPAAISSFSKMDYPDIAFRVLREYIGSALPETELIRLLKDAYDFEVPIEKADDKTYIMRLDRGPTASFKDFAARFMARMMARLKPAGKKITILVATSGDTGSAVGEAFKGLEGIKVYILYPTAEVSPIQKKQLDSIGENVSALELSGTFDDCQKIVKQAFFDKDLQHLNLSSANSINIARILPQSVYYFYAFSRVSMDGQPIIFSVPSGNLGNSFGCEVARRMGLPVKRLILAVNSNKEVAELLQTGEYRKIEPSVNCISNAMNVGNPSNLARYFDAFGGWLEKNGDVLKKPDLTKMNEILFSRSISDEETRQTIVAFHNKYKILLEPHGAVGVRALELYRAINGSADTAVCLETAHPAKFPETITSELGLVPELPEALKHLNGRESCSVRLPCEFQAVKEYISGCN